LHGLLRAHALECGAKGIDWPQSNDILNTF
jgi:hypothetical protein